MEPGCSFQSSGWLASLQVGETQLRRWQPELPLMDIFCSIKKDINQTQFIKQQQQQQQTASSSHFHSAISRLSLFGIALNLISNIHRRLRTGGHTEQANEKLRYTNINIFFYSRFNLSDVVEQLGIVSKNWMGEGSHPSFGVLLQAWLHSGHGTSVE